MKQLLTGLYGFGAFALFGLLTFDASAANCSLRADIGGRTTLYYRGGGYNQTSCANSFSDAFVKNHAQVHSNWIQRPLAAGSTIRGTVKIYHGSTVVKSYSVSYKVSRSWKSYYYQSSGTTTVNQTSSVAGGGGGSSNQRCINWGGRRICW